MLFLDMFLQAGPIGTKLLALKFLETYILLFTSSDGEKSGAQGNFLQDFKDGRFLVQEIFQDSLSEYRRFFMIHYYM